MASVLFSPIMLRNLTLQNRVMISPMCQYSATDGNASDWHVIHLGHLALGGVGLVCLEATGVEAIGRISPHCLGLYSDDNEAALRRVLNAVRPYSDVPFCIQLAHAGRKASSNAPWNGGQLMEPSKGGWVPVAPSAVPHAEHEPAPRALERGEMPRLVETFANATRRAARLGFEAVELHAAHGYLLHEFLSPISNRRDDEYGGPLENRMRLPLEVFRAMRAEWPKDRPMGVRLSCTDWVEGGWDVDQSVRLARELKALGCDWIDCSSGAVSPKQKIPLGPGYQVPFAERIRQETGIATIAVGLITEPAQAEEIVASNKADLVALARAILYDPRWAWHAAAALGGKVKGPRQYWRSLPSGVQPIFGDLRLGTR